MIELHFFQERETHGLVVRYLVLDLTALGGARDGRRLKEPGIQNGEPGFIFFMAALTGFLS